METWEIYNATPDEIKFIREWARKRPVTVELVDSSNICVNCGDTELEDELAQLCDDYGIKSRLL